MLGGGRGGGRGTYAPATANANAALLRLHSLFPVHRAFELCRSSTAITARPPPKTRSKMPEMRRREGVFVHARTQEMSAHSEAAPEIMLTLQRVLERPGRVRWMYQALRPRM